jgi:hypothetical protein
VAYQEAMVTSGDQIGLEQALARLQEDAEAALKAAGGVVAALKRVRAAAQTGSLRDLRPALRTAESAVDALAEATGTVKAAWDVDEERFFEDGAFARELLAAAASRQLKMYEQDDRLYVYPAIVQIIPSERAVLIDRRRERRLRPSFLAGHLQELQDRPARFKPEAFLEALFDAYRIALDRLKARRGDAIVGEGEGTTVRLVDVYDLLTLLPGQAREYSRLEFGRDVYLLEQSEVKATRQGHHVSFPSSTGTRRASGTIRVVTQDGRERLYYGIAFHPAAPLAPPVQRPASLTLDA